MVRIERATVQGVQGIRNVLAVTWRDTYSSFLSESSIAKVTAEWHTPRVLEAEIVRASTFSGVARASETSEEIVGMITAHSRDELLVVTRLYVLPAYQRQGIGQRLMNASYLAFPGSLRVQLDVEEQNPKGRAFYERVGFKEVGRKIDEVAGTKLQSIVMERRIRDAA
ncbi:MAG: GNAT family N-acetyltransferase [Anaerolineales bacterium]